MHNLLMQLFTLSSSKIEVPETCFFDIVITQNDHSRYVKHVLGRIYVFYPYFGCVLLEIDSVRGGLIEGNRIFVLQAGKFRAGEPM